MADSKENYLTDLEWKGSSLATQEVVKALIDTVAMAIGMPWDKRSKATICGSNIKDGKHGEWKKHLKESLNDQKRLFQVYSYRVWESKNLTENMQEEFCLG